MIIPQYVIRLLLVITPGRAAVFSILALTVHDNIAAIKHPPKPVKTNPWD